MIYQQEKTESGEIVEIDPRSGTISMTSFQASEKITVMLEEERRLWASGQEEYARGENVFGNFTRLSEALGLPPETILLVYALKHLDGIISWINGNESQREDVRGRINDLRVYLAILHLMVEAYEDVSAAG